MVHLKKCYDGLCTVRTGIIQANAAAAAAAECKFEEQAQAIIKMDFGTV